MTPAKMTLEEADRARHGWGIRAYDDSITF